VARGAEPTDDGLGLFDLQLDNLFHGIFSQKGSTLTSSARTQIDLRRLITGTNENTIRFNCEGSQRAIAIPDDRPRDFGRSRRHRRVTHALENSGREPQKDRAPAAAVVAAAAAA
jgi:hypothetical protein